MARDATATAMPTRRGEPPAGGASPGGPAPALRQRAAKKRQRRERHEAGDEEPAPPARNELDAGQREGGEAGTELVEEAEDPLGEAAAGGRHLLGGDDGGRGEPTLPGPARSRLPGDQPRQRRRETPAHPQRGLARHARPA